MKTWQAILAHFAVTGCQILAASPIISGNNPQAVLANTAVQLGVQAALTALNAWVSAKNSNSDPKSNALVKTGAETYATSTEAVK